MVPVTPAKKVSVFGPADMPSTQQGPALEDLTHSQNVKLCQDIMDEVINTIVGCDEGGSHGLHKTSPLASALPAASWI